MVLSAGLVGHEEASPATSFSAGQIAALVFFGVIALSGVAFRLLARVRYP